MKYIDATIGSCVKANDDGTLGIIFARFPVEPAGGELRVVFADWGNDIRFRDLSPADVTMVSQAGRYPSLREGT